MFPSPHTTTRAITSAGHALLRLLYPPRCAGCSAASTLGELPLCARCVRQLERPEPPQIEGRLARLPKAQEVLDGVTALWLFDTHGTVQQVQHLLKYGNRPRHGQALGRLMGRAYRETDLPLPDLIVPIPLHKTRRYERGYNQSTMLARGLSDALAIPIDDTVLIRSRATRSQTHLSRPQRWANVAGAFSVPSPEALAGRTLVLVDDVLTTGATLAAASQVVQRHGAASVYAATLALARR